MLGLLLGGKMNRGTMALQNWKRYVNSRNEHKLPYVVCTMHYETPKENKENPQSTTDKTIN